MFLDIMIIKINFAFFNPFIALICEPGIVTVKVNLKNPIY